MKYSELERKLKKKVVFLSEMVKSILFGLVQKQEKNFKQVTIKVKR